METSDRKRELRAVMQERIAALSPQQRSRESAEICARILALLSPGMIAVCGYVPLADEADITPVLRTLLERGTPVFLPRHDDGEISFCAVKNMDADLGLGAFGIPEPRADAPTLPAENATIILVPGRAFNREGMRLGRGKGGYDRCMEKLRMRSSRVQCWGIAYDEQMVENIPWETHDQRMDLIVTPTLPVTE